MARVVRLTEQELTGLVQDIINMALNPSKSSSTSSDGSTDSGDEIEDETKDTSIGKVSAKGQELLNDPTFKKKLKEISNEIDIPESSILKLMKHESGFDPTIKNKIGCVGLIQFCPDGGGGSTKTIAGKTYKLNELQNDLELQMDAIKEFWLAGKKSGKIKRPVDLYIYNFFPVAAGKPDNFVLQTKGLSAEKVANSNPIFNRVLGKSKSSPITVADLRQYYQQTNMV
jgi:hypothetical protein